MKKVIIIGPPEEKIRISEIIKNKITDIQIVQIDLPNRLENSFEKIEKIEKIVKHVFVPPKSRKDRRKKEK